MPKKLPIGISNHREIIEEGYVYVDKGRYVYELASTGKYYFLSRPRRFGKSLFVDTLKEAFEGNKELFKGLWLYDHWDWEKRYPVIHISFGSGVLRNRAELDRRIIRVLEDNQKRPEVRCQETTYVAGYLTINNHYRQDANIVYELSYPNLEVKTSLNDYILLCYSGTGAKITSLKIRLYKVLEGGDVDGIREVMHSHFASIPYDWHRKNNIDQYEGYYASVFYSYFASIGVEVKAEEPTSYGKVDMAVVMPKAVYVFEFKVIEGEEGTGEALEQIKQKGYGDRYKGICRGVLQYAPIYLIGIEFSKTKRQIVGFYMDRLQVVRLKE
jgi:hypothetical protein